MFIVTIVKKMDIRTPDSYKNEILVDSNQPQHSSQDISCHELEIAMLQSMEEAWAKDAECAVLWSSFQPFLIRLKRIGNYDNDLRKIHDMLSVLLYKYAYHSEDFLTEETYEWIEKHLKTIRILPLERDLLTKAFTHLRYGL